MFMHSWLLTAVGLTLCLAAGAASAEGPNLGKPIDAETGVPTSALYDAVLAGDGQSSAVVAQWFGVPVQAVQAAATFAAW